MGLGIGARKRQLRLALGMDLEKGFPLGHDLAHGPEQQHPCRDMRWRTGALGDTSHFPAVEDKFE